MLWDPMSLVWLLSGWACGSNFVFGRWYLRFHQGSSCTALLAVHTKHGMPQMLATITVLDLNKLNRIEMICHSTMQFRLLTAAAHFQQRRGCTQVLDPTAVLPAQCQAPWHQLHCANRSPSALLTPAIHFIKLSCMSKHVARRPPAGSSGGGLTLPAPLAHHVPHGLQPGQLVS
ncbi:hypothetical protein COO60DRAFT_295887 [Scenedesmus sp. NREL 46B-D3]|nr:hypothetical protein COO60DRAFT_295887 [Scenedesmus sp. NREL 46B-D3]